ncbi:MAG: hypothetical protein N3E51_04275, partial [Candidatus Micrarchaeota archaeon]|nr:hypothetical protein [Candidatus Micrarchaeota archaeon]
MELRFHDLTDYFHHPPKLESLQGETKDCRRRKRGEVLLIIPSYHDSKRLKRMLDGLARQSFKKFDIAIIYASDDKFVPSRRLPIIHVRRKIDLGYA